MNCVSFRENMFLLYRKTDLIIGGEKKPNKKQRNKRKTTATPPDFWIHLKSVI